MKKVGDYTMAEVVTAPIRWFRACSWIDRLVFIGMIAWAVAAPLIIGGEYYMSPLIAATSVYVLWFGQMRTKVTHTLEATESIYNEVVIDLARYRQQRAKMVAESEVLWEDFKRGHGG